MATRRRVLGTGLAATTGAILMGGRAAAARDDAEADGEGTAEADAEGGRAGLGRADHPAWSFAALALQDPYEGQVDRLITESGGTRVVAVEVAIDNASDQPLSFAAVDVRARTSEGIEHRAGALIGDEPRLAGRNLKPGERAQGWVWFDIPEDARVAEVVLAGPAPQWRIPLPE